MSKKNRKLPPRAASAPGAMRPVAPPAVAQSTPPPAGWRRWWFRLTAAAAVPLLVLAALESALRLAGFGDATEFFLKTQHDHQTVYVQNQKFSRRFFPPALVRHSEPCLMEAVKPSGTCRIFVLGESAAMGDPAPAFSFGRILAVLLQDHFPQTQFEVINPSITAINSHVVLPIARECARHEGDLWVIYLGNNEVVGPYGAGTVFGAQVPSLGLIRASIALKATRLGQALGALGRRWGGSGNTPKTWGGMEMFLNQQVRQADPRMERVYAYFQRNLQAIIRSGAASGAKVLVCTLASNLKDCAPFASLHRPDLTAAALAQWEQAYQAGVALETTTNFVGALEKYKLAAQEDDQDADLAYRMGRCYLALGRWPETKQAFQRARDQDALRFRADSRINQIIRQTVQNLEGRGVDLVDGERALAEHSPGGLTGDELLYEHVHLTFEGNYWLARALAERAKKLLPAPAAQPGTAPSAWLSAEDCAQRLAFTDWDRYQGIEMMWKRMQEPPFTHQLDWTQRNERWQGRLAQLRPQTKPFALRGALEAHREAVARSPRDWYLREGYARILQASADDEGALEQWRQALKLMPNNPQVTYSVGNLLDNLGKSADAQAWFEAALHLRPEFSDALNGLGLCLVNQGKYAEALKCYQQAIEYNPDSAEIRVNLGLVLMHLRQTEAAVAQYNEALRLKPNSPSAHLNLGKVLSGQGKITEAAAHYAEAARLMPEDPIVHFNLANALLAQGRTVEALAQYSTAVELKPDFIEARLNLGLELARQGRPEEALAQFSEAVRRKPNHVEARLDLGVALARQRRFREAIPHFQEVLRLEPGNQEARKNLEAATALLQKGP